MTCGGLSLNFAVNCGLVTNTSLSWVQRQIAHLSVKRTPERVAVFGRCGTMFIPSTGFISFVNVRWCDVRVIAPLVGAYQVLVVSASFSGKKTINGDPQQLCTC